MISDKKPIPVPYWNNPQSLWQYIRAARENLLNIIPPSSTTQGFTTFPSRFGNTHYISDLDILKTMLKTRPEEFPKSKSIQILLEPVVPYSMLITQGEKWKDQHKTMIPVFNHRNIQKFAPLIEQKTDEFLNIHFSTSPQIHDVSKDMIKLTYQVIAEVLLGAKDAYKLDLVHQHLDFLLTDAARMGFLDFPAIAFDRFPNTRKLRFLKIKKQLRKALNRIVFDRLNEPQPEKFDFLEHLLMAYDMRQNFDQTNLREIEDNILTFLVAGHETTAVTLSWALYAVSFFKETQEKIRSETDRPINERVVTENFIKEVLRFYPAVPIISRVTTKAEKFGTFEAKNREGIIIPILSIHRHQEYWDSPDEFKPDRFVNFKPLPMSYLPFGAGPRICIGASFAQMETVIIFSKLIEKFEISSIDHTPEPQLTTTLRSQNGIHLQLKSRNKS